VPFCHHDTLIMEASKLLSAASNMPNSQAYGLLRCAAGKLIGGIEIRQKKGMERPGHAWIIGFICASYFGARAAVAVLTAGGYFETGAVLAAGGYSEIGELGLLGARSGRCPGCLKPPLFGP
jgi:hypothetical protein